MTPQEFRDALKALGLSYRQATGLLGCSVRSVNKYADLDGKGPPVAEGRLLRLLLSLSPTARKRALSDTHTD